MQKAKKYDWKDSNMALFGSDTEKSVKKESAQTEPAWKGSGQKPGLQIWRIVKFHVTDWPKEEYGNFYDGDSYIILNTYKDAESDELHYDVHFWIGKYSTQDEYGTAAYKTVELDTFHNDKPIQHREVQGHESVLFKGYFKQINYMKGGADSGFRRVEPEQYKPRLLHFKKEGPRVTMTEVARKQSKLQDGDVFVLDLGLTIYQWNGAAAQGIEKFEAGKAVSKIKSDRGRNIETIVLEQAAMSATHKFYNFLDDDDDDDDDDNVPIEGEPTLFRVSDDDGSLDMEQVKSGVIIQKDLKTEDVFIIDTKSEVFVWIGKGASVDERRNGFSYAHKYLMKTEYPYLPVSIVSEGQKSDAFNAAVPMAA
ncbi:gelsolin-like protein 1 isoform X1 [Dreissena polymorpha]|nr:gelsolin-like protein 1 isoform X1 [Dreissena polymorpha]XP_052260853.1 gelsolin-like protein 1 isoform X1 [Dreissena polymorpha]